MVNLDKWEKIEFDDIRRGDLIRKIVTDKNGVHFDARGEAHRPRQSFDGSAERWLSSDENGWIVARRRLTSTTATQALYRRKPKALDIPENIGAVLVGYKKRADGLEGTKELFVRLVNKRWVSQRDGFGYSTSYLKELYNIGAVLSEGVTL